MSNSGGSKYDGGKTQMDLLDPEFLADVADVLTFGACKYAPHNWRKGINTSRVYAAAQRHLNAFWGGEELDPESGLSHLAHAACCIQFLHWTAANLPEYDDRWSRGGGVEL